MEFLLLKKKSGDYWPRLMKEKGNYNWLAVDFSRYMDQDEEEENEAEKERLVREAAEAEALKDVPVVELDAAGNLDQATFEMLQERQMQLTQERLSRTKGMEQLD